MRLPRDLSGRDLPGRLEREDGYGVTSPREVLHGYSVIRVSLDDHQGAQRVIAREDDSAPQPRKGRD